MTAPVTVESKRCGDCGEVKPHTEFYKKKRKSSYGLESRCKPCKAEYGKRHYRKNVDQMRERKRNWWREDLERARNCRRRSVVKNREQRKLYARVYRKRHPEKTSALAIRWRQENPEKYRAIQSKAAAARRARVADAPRIEYCASQLAERWAYYGNKCWLCGAPAVATDHVKPLAKGGADMLCNLRPACKPCNSRKRDTWPLAAVWERFSRE